MATLQRELERLRRTQTMLHMAAVADANRKEAQEKRRLELLRKEEHASAAAAATPMLLGSTRSLSAPVMHTVKKVLDVLQAVSPHFMTAAQILEQSGIDLTRDPEVGHAVAVNPKVRYQPPPTTGEHAGDANYAQYGFRSAFPEVGTARQLADLLVSRAEGTSLKQLSECYPAAHEDALQLVEDGLLWVVANGETGDKTLFPRDKSLESAPVSEKIKHIWLRMEVPTDPTALAAELHCRSLRPGSLAQAGAMQQPLVAVIVARNHVAPPRPAASSAKGVCARRV